MYVCMYVCIYYCRWKMVVLCQIKDVFFSRLLTLEDGSIALLLLLLHHHHHLAIIAKEVQLPESLRHTATLAVDHMVDRFSPIERLYLQTAEKHFRTQNYLLALITYHDRMNNKKSPKCREIFNIHLYTYIHTYIHTHTYIHKINK